MITILRRALARQTVGGASATCPVEVGGASDADFLLAKLHIEQHGLVRLGPGEVEPRLQPLGHGDAILEGALIEAVAGEL